MLSKLEKGSLSDPFLLQKYTRILIVLTIVTSLLQSFHGKPWPAAISDGLFLIVGFLTLLIIFFSCEKVEVNFSNDFFILGFFLVVHSIYFLTATSNRSIAPYVLVIGIAFSCYKLCRNRSDIFLLFLLGISLSAILTSFISGGEWLGVWESFSSRSSWVFYTTPGTVLVGNLSQPNNMGSLLVWGLLSTAMLEENIKAQKNFLWYSFITASLTTASVISVSLATALTHSRTTSLEMVALILLTYLYRQYFGRRVLELIILATAIHFLTVIFLPQIKSLLFDASATDVFNGKSMVDGARLYAYQIFVESILSQPLLGYGLGGITNAFLNSAPLDKGIGVYFGHTHNIVLDLLVCFGIPLGGWLTYKICTFLFYGLIKVKTVNEATAAVMTVTFLIHAMLELPHHYAYFLIPVGVICSQLPHKIKVYSFSISIKWIYLFSGILFVLFLLIANEYLKIEQNIRTARLQLAITGQASSPSDDPAYFLSELKGMDFMIRTPVSDKMSAEKLDIFKATLINFPSLSFFRKYSLALELNGQSNEANHWRNLGCAIYKIKPCPTSSASIEKLSSLEELDASSN